MFSSALPAPGPVAAVSVPSMLPSACAAGAANAAPAASSAISRTKAPMRHNRFTLPELLELLITMDLLVSLP